MKVTCWVIDYLVAADHLDGRYPEYRILKKEAEEIAPIFIKLYIGAISWRVRKIIFDV